MLIMSALSLLLPFVSQARRSAVSDLLNLQYLRPWRIFDLAPKLPVCQYLIVATLANLMGLRVSH